MKKSKAIYKQVLADFANTYSYWTDDMIEEEVNRRIKECSKEVKTFEAEV